MKSTITSEKKIQKDGKDISLFKLQNQSGAYVEVLTYGATLVSVVVPDKDNTLENVVLRYDNLEDYFSDSFYLGGTIGRFANRISNARFELNGEIFHLDKNDGENSNHGGFNGFNKKLFTSQIKDDTLVLFAESKDGEGGFPGSLHFMVIYSWSEDNELTIQYKAISDKDTVFNPTNHAYFHLSAGKRNTLNHELKVYADNFLEMNDEFLPTGNIFPIQNTAFDFREFQPISKLMPLKKEILKGYNAYFIGREDSLLASLQEKDSQRSLDVYSDMPGVQFYTGDYLTAPHKPFGGLCLEAQFFPDAPNHSNFPSCTLYADTEVGYSIKYKFNISQNA